MNRPQRTILLAVASLLISAAAAVAQPPAPAAIPDLTGEWSGHWESCKNGHNGPLHARFCLNNDGSYDVVFRGRFFKVVPFRYKATLAVVGQQGDQVLLHSEKRLPGLGTFRMDASATATDFTARWTSRDDEGLFVLQRDAP